MNLTEEQIKSIKDEAAKELGWAELFAGASETILNLRYKKWFEDIIDRCMQLSYQQAMKDVEAELPLEITPDELQQDYEDMMRDYGTDYASGFSDGGQYYWKQLREEIIDILNKLRKQ